MWIEINDVCFVFCFFLLGQNYFGSNTYSFKLHWNSTLFMSRRDISPFEIFIFIVMKLTSGKARISHSQKDGIPRCCQLEQLYSLESSACIWINELLISVDRLLMNKINNRGPRVVPWSTPVLSVVYSVMITLPVKKLENHVRKCPPIQTLDSINNVFFMS